jgi:co-chaperonin GroES (HSP10)
MNLKPMPDHLLVRLDSLAEESSGGIILTDKVKRKALLSATVLRITDGECSKHVTVKEGDTIYFDQYNYYGQKLDPEDIDIFMININDVELVLDKEKSNGE